MCVSDLGSQLTSDINVISNYLNDFNTKKYFSEHNVNPVKFQQYFKSRSQLGSLVESCVKATKRLLFGSIKNILSYHDFKYIICYVVHIINRRPIAYKEKLRHPELDIQARSLQNV